MIPETVLSRLAAERLTTLFGEELAMGLPAGTSAGRQRRDKTHAVSSERHADVTLDIFDGRSRRRVYATVKPRLLRAYVDAFSDSAARLHTREPNAISLFVVPRLTARARAELREAHLNYADLTGTVYVRAPGIVIDREGTRENEPLAADRGPDPFTDRASLVLRALLARPDAWFRVTELAAEAGVTKGWVSRVAKALELRAYIERSGARVRLADPVRVLVDWSARYSWADNRIESYVAPFDYPELLTAVGEVLAEVQASVALTLLAASDLVAPHVRHGQVHLYVESTQWASVRDHARRRLSLEPVRHGGNFHLLDPYYRDSVFFHRHEVRGLPVVSPVQLYLDLVHFPVRGAEAAAMLARTTLARSFSLSPAQVRELT